MGAGPNGLAAAIELARNGISVLVLEASRTVGGAARTEELTLPGFRHDVGSAVFPMGVGSPFFASLPLAEHGLEWIHHEVPLAHPLDGGRAVLLRRSVEDTAWALGDDAPAYQRLMRPFVRRWETLAEHVLDTPLRVPRDPLLMARFGLLAVQSAERLAATFDTIEARALLGGNAAHSGAPLDSAPTAAIALVLMAAGHAVGWPVAKGGAGSITRALASLLESFGGKIETDARVGSLDELPPARAVLLAITSRQVAAVAGSRLPAGYRRRLATWRYGAGAFKLDWALGGPIPWLSDACRRAGTVHLGGSFAELQASEAAPAAGRAAERPFVLLAQPSLVDPGRAPEGQHTAWAYCHVPNGWQGDATAAVEAQLERFAPGFGERVLARRAHTPGELEAWDTNLVGGDVNGGAFTLLQTLGPGRWKLDPWTTPVKGLYVCSASTPPGGGVHGMCGYHAARAALTKSFGM